MADSGSKKKVANGLVALSSAAVLAVYGAGYSKTRAAADRFAQQAADRQARTPLTRGDALSLGAEPATPPAAPIEPETRTEAAPVSKSDTLTTPRPAASAEAAPSVASNRSSSPESAPAASTANVATKAATTSQPAVPSTAAPAAAAQTAATATDSTPPAAEQAPSAPAPVIATAIGENAPYKDGTYYGWGSCRHGDIQAAIVIEGGRMASATVAQCLTRYACSWIDPLLPHTVRKQAATADYVSGATESSEAFNDAVSEALLQAH